MRIFQRQQNWKKWAKLVVLCLCPSCSTLQKRIHSLFSTFSRTFLHRCENDYFLAFYEYFLCNCSCWFDTILMTSKYVVLKNLIFVENVEVYPIIPTIKPAIKARSKRCCNFLSNFRSCSQNCKIYVYMYWDTLIEVL